MGSKIRNFVSLAAAAGKFSMLALALLAIVSCSASADLAIRNDRSLTLSLSLEIPAAVEAKLRSLSSLEPGQALVDPLAIRRGAEARGMQTLRSSSPSPASYLGSFTLPDIQAFSLSPAMADTGLFSYGKGQGWASLRIRINRDNASALLSIFPGADEELLEALQPPALYDNPVSKAEYRSMLLALLGKSTAEALDSARFSLSLSLPGPILESEGLAIAGMKASGASFSLPVLDALTLEQPVELYARWQE
jgi:hypothetical protein